MTAARREAVVAAATRRSERDARGISGRAIPRRRRARGGGTASGSRCGAALRAYRSTTPLVACGAAMLGGTIAALLAGAAFVAYATDQATLGALVLKSPSVTNAAHT